MNQHMWQGSEVNEDLLLCKPLPTLTTGNEMFRILDNFLTKMKSHGRNLKTCARPELKA